MVITDVVCTDHKLVELRSYTNAGCSVNELSTTSTRLSMRKTTHCTNSQVPLGENNLCWAYRVINRDGTATITSVNNITCLKSGAALSYVTWNGTVDCTGHSTEVTIPFGQCILLSPNDEVRWMFTDNFCCLAESDAKGKCRVGKTTAGFTTRERVYLNGQRCKIPEPTPLIIPEIGKLVNSSKNSLLQSPQVQNGLTYGLVVMLL